jgi:prepilin-type processing-associated H-X9-DG protein/prepilin-type N-terminal cleavage/methylation domain-containing protein
MPRDPTNKPMNCGWSPAFTLMELLVVITVISILAALLLPVISQSKRRAQLFHCVSNLHQLGLGLQSFVAANHAYPSCRAGMASEIPGSWMNQLQQGGFDTQQGAFDISRPKPFLLTEGVWRCPTARWDQRVAGGGIPTSYGYNAFGILKLQNPTNALGLHGKFISSSQLFAPVPESEVSSPGEMMAIGDSFEGGNYIMREPDLAYLERCGFASSRHNGRANILFCDGHVGSPTLKFVFTDSIDAALVRWNRDHQPHRDRL